MSTTQEAVSKMWHAVTIQCADADEGSAIAHALGASLIETVSDNVVRAFIEANAEELESFIVSFPEGMSILQVELVPEKNWHESCEDLWKSVRIGQLTVTPIPTVEAAKARANDELLIIPGTGFGTGHHPATAMLMELIQHQQILQPKTVLDLGCGSGILAIVARIVWPDAEIVAIDNDPLALENASDILSANKISDIKLICGTLEQLPLQKVDLVIANLYSSLLLSLAKPLTHITSQLFVSGVMEVEQEQLVAGMLGAGWSLNSARTINGWYSAHLIR